MLLVSVFVLISALGLLAGVLLGRHHVVVDEDVPTWQTTSGLIIMGLGLVVEAFGMVLLVRSGMWGGRWRSPTAVLTRDQRKALTRQVMGKAAVDQRRLRLARDLAQRLINSRLLMVMYVGLVIAVVGQVVGDPSLFQEAFTGLMLVMFAVTGVLFEVYARRGRRFLGTYPAPETGE